MHAHAVPLPRLWRWLTLFFALLCFSCSSGPSLNHVEGKVTYQGQPLAGAAVVFHEDGKDTIRTVPPNALTKEDGTFVLETNSVDGAPAGNYTVTITCPESTTQPGSKGPISMAPALSKDRLKGAYATIEKSKIKVEIKPGRNNLQPFDLQEVK